MKKVKISPIHCILALVVAIILVGGTLILSGCGRLLSFDEDGDYRFHFTEYAITYDVSADRTMQVEEKITVSFDGRDCTGFFVDIPVNGGEQVKNIKVTELDHNDGVEKPVAYSVDIEDNAFISVDIGDTSLKHGNYTYFIRYTYCMTRAQEGKNILSINAVTTDHSFKMQNVTVTINLPAECLWAEYYTGKGGSENPVECGENISTVSFHEDMLAADSGLTFMIGFEDGILSTYFDFTPYWFVIAAAVVLVILILIKLFVFNKITLTPIVNFEAPDGMDPLMMGKLIDNKVGAEDVTSLIFYWADKGYIKINLDNKNNPALIRIKNLPATATKYEQIVYAGLFQKGDLVKTSDLKYVFYRTFEKAKSVVNGSAKGLHSSVSIGISIMFAVLGGLLVGLTPMILGLVLVSSTLTYLYGFIALIPALVLYAFSETVKYNRLKNKNKKNALYFFLLALGLLACAGIFILIIPSSLLSIIPKVLLCILSFAISATSVLIISRTKEYNEKLNHIVGFRNFIMAAEKDRLEALLESDPQYYYHVLPYAQVLNVSDIWEDKFKAITVAPPSWATASSFDVFDFIILNRMIRISTQSLSAGMVSRPSSSGRSGGHGGFGGGRGGGHVGGGHGGSSFRGR